MRNLNRRFIQCFIGLLAVLNANIAEALVAGRDVFVGRYTDQLSVAWYNAGWLQGMSAMCVTHNGQNPDAGGNIQLDTDADGYGNLCDGVLNNDGNTNTLDLNLYKPAHRSALGDANYVLMPTLTGTGSSTHWI